MSKRTNTTLFVIVFSIMFLLVGNSQTAYSQTFSDTYSIKLVVSPSHVDQGANVHHIGYIYLLGKGDVPITAPMDISIQLISDKPDLAGVPDEVLLKAGDEYATFEITTGSKSGETFITATLNSKSSFQKILVGNSATHLPSDLVLELNIPTEEMHVNSAMPFSVYLKTSTGNVIRAPYDIDVQLEFEKTLASPQSEVLTIKKGEYYVWSTFETYQKVGNTFLRATQDDYGLDTAKSIKISSTLPAKLKIDVFPKELTIDVNRKVDIFVSVVDSDGNPTITPVDIPLKFFSNQQYLVGEKLDDALKNLKPAIKKGQFGYYFKQTLNLSGQPLNNIEIGVSAEGYGVATDTFSIYKKPLSIDDKKLVDEKNPYKMGMQLFVPDTIPSNATMIATYQIHALENDADDPEIVGTETTDKEDKLIFSIDDLDEKEPYPIQAKDTYYADKYVKKLEVITSDSTIATVKEIGKIESTSSFGTAIISSGQKSGPVTISASVQGIGSASYQTTVVNTLEQKEVRIFSPTGTDSILFNREGNFDVFLIAIDAKDRPKVVKHDSKYLITPTNGLIEIEKGSTFTFTKLRSDSFMINEINNSIALRVVPIGEDANLNLNSQKTFVTQPSSKIQVLLPTDKINSHHENNVGVVQLVDFQGNPIVPKAPVKSKIGSSDNTIVNVGLDAIIPPGLSYATFPIKTTGLGGTSVISASAKGVNGTSQEINSVLSATKLKISTRGLGDEIKPDLPVEIKLFVDNESNESINGAFVKIETDDNSIVNPNVVRTNLDGSAQFSLTATAGPSTSIKFIATADGYTEGENSVIVMVDAPKKGFSIANVVLPDWIAYVIIAIILVMGVMVMLFLKKSKIKVKEEWEEEEI